MPLSKEWAKVTTKGVHDMDAAKILAALIQMHQTLGLLRYAPSTRICAALAWAFNESDDEMKLLAARIKAYGSMCDAFPDSKQDPDYRLLLQNQIESFIQSTGLFDTSLIFLLESPNIYFNVLITFSDIAIDCSNTTIVQFGLHGGYGKEPS